MHDQTTMYKLINARKPEVVYYAYKTMILSEYGTLAGKGMMQSDSIIQRN